MYKIGLSTCGREVTEELCQGYKNAGIEVLEVYYGPDLLERADLRDARKLADKYELGLWSFHLPFYPYGTCEISQWEHREKVIANLTELIKKAASVGIDKFVIHPSGEPIQENRAERMKCAKDSLAHLAEIAKAEGGILAVENLPRTCLGNTPEEMLELLGAHKELRVCLDTNHMLNQDVCKSILAMGSKIVTIHVSDYDYQNERHWLPGEGDISWQDVISAFKEVGYNGPWLYELVFACPDSIIRSRNLNYEDIGNNARELFAGKKPTTVCTRIEGLGMWPEKK